MPETPVLTKKQQKSSLSAKKTKTRQSLRNVLAIPYSSYWPLLSSSEYCEQALDVLRKHLPKIKPYKVSVPWKELKEIPRSERKVFREEYIKKLYLSGSTAEDRNGLIFGVNDITKALEKGLVRSVLITSDVKPKLMVEHLIDQSVLLQIPVLVVPGLRNVLKNACGFSSIAIAFTESDKYKEVQTNIDKIYRQYPVPHDHINFQRSVESADSSVIVVEDESISKNNPKMYPNSDSHNRIESYDSGKADECIKDIMVSTELENVYLYRKTASERIFIPEKSCDAYKDGSQMQLDSSSFLSFSVDPSPSTKINFKSLKVKKIRGDMNRNKRKIEEIKLKKHFTSRKNI